MARPITSMKIEGLEQLIKQFDSYKKRIRSKWARRAINAGSKVIIKASRSLVSMASGTLKKSIGVRIWRGRAGDFFAYIGPRRDSWKAVTLPSGQIVIRDPRKYAHLIEFGVQPHTLAKGDTLERLTKGGRVSKASRQTGRPHPGFAARPFLRPALDENKRAIEAAMAEVLREGLRVEASNPAALKSA